MVIFLFSIFAAKETTFASQRKSGSVLARWWLVCPILNKLSYGGLAVATKRA